MEKLTQFLMNLLNTQNIYIINIIYTILTFLILKIVSKCLKILNMKTITEEKQIYIIQKRNKAIFTLLFCIITLIIWQNEFKDIIL